MKIIKWIIRIALVLFGLGLLGLFVWLGVSIGQKAGLI